MDRDGRTGSGGGRRRVLITGLGVVASCGVGLQEFWAGLLRPHGPERVREVEGDVPGAPDQSPAELKRYARFTRFALAAAGEALADAALLPGAAPGGPVPGIDASRAGVYIGNGSGGTAERAAQDIAFHERGRRGVSPLTVPKAMPNAASAAVSIRWGLRGPCETVSTACASGTHSLAGAALAIASGRIDIAVAGGAEASLTGASIAAYDNMRALSMSGVSRPFDRDRDGFVLSEGAGVLVLESAEHAAARGARAYAELAGAASNSDAHHMTAPRPGGTGAQDCMRLALEDAGLVPEDVVHINAHGTSTRFNDAAEAHAVSALFGGRPAVTSIKGVTGHSLGAAGAIEAVASALSYAHRTLPPTNGTGNVDPDLDIDVVLEPRPWEPGPSLSNSFGFGGHNGSVVLLPA
ncbi:beta-ketoacyl-[acyl-carrier-protein] synthase family protein [Nocardiopsis alba]|uniref:beta-ketoacyl-[acyl-carrier-protein] synthase family protein n=1 Tax=Nocardiopsis alba TaxID=53437 RepID=UPI0035DF1D7A